MAVNAPQILFDNWHHFVDNGATKEFLFQEMGISKKDGSGQVVTPVLSTTPIDPVIDSTTKYPWILEDDETVMDIDKVAIIPSMALPVVPKINDIMVSASSNEWKVKGVLPDSCSAHWELWIRPIK